MKLLIFVALLGGYACGGKPAAKTEALQTDLTACKKNVTDIQTRVRGLMGEKLKVMENRANLPAGYDPSSIDQTLAQIESELMMRQDSAARMAARCETIEDKLRRAEQPETH